MAQRTERIAQFVTDRPPTQDQRVQVLCEDHVGTYALPYLCLWTEAGWINAVTMSRLEMEVLGWREPLVRMPARRHAQHGGPEDERGAR